MTDRQDDNTPPPGKDGDSDAEPDLRSIMDGGTARRRVLFPEPEYREERPADDRGTGEEIAPPYEPPVRAGDEQVARPGRRTSARPQGRPVADRPETSPETEQEQEKLPPVWPGDEDQPWFRRERGLPPLPGQDGTPALNPEDFPTPLADIPPRGRAFGISVLMPVAVSLILTSPILAIIFYLANIFLFRQGQDVGALLFRLRVVRENGDVAGFFQMFVRNAASLVSMLVLGAGFWGAFSDPYRRTWHDRWLGTYVVNDSKEYNRRRRSSSEQAFKWFWIILMLIVGISVLLWLNAPLPSETTTNGGSG